MTEQSNAVPSTARQAVERWLATGGEMLTALHINHARTAGLPFAALSNRVKSMTFSR